jgi:hypothetical protein
MKEAHVLQRVLTARAYGPKALVSGTGNAMRTRPGGRSDGQYPSSRKMMRQIAGPFAEYEKARWL